MIKISCLKTISAALIAFALMSYTSSIYAQNSNKVVVIPMAGDNIRYTGNAPIVVNQSSNTISFDTSALSVTSNEVEISQPSLVVNCLIDISGLFPSRTEYLGDIKYVGFNFAQRGWAHCNGQLLTISQNSALFSLLGTIYGGDGRTTFALPDMRGRVPVHVGAGPGLTPRTQGQKYGNEAVTPTIKVVTP